MAEPVTLRLLTWTAQAAHTQKSETVWPPSTRTRAEFSLKTVTKKTVKF